MGKRIKVKKRQGRHGERVEREPDAAPTGEIVWHYTAGVHFPAIIMSGVLRVSGLGLDPGERPAVWFSTEPDWEPTAGKLGAWTRDEVAKRAGNVIRFGVDAAHVPHSWADHRAAGGITPQGADALEGVARDHSANPARWRVSYKPIPRRLWAVIDVLDQATGQWQRVHPKTDGE